MTIQQLQYVSEVAKNESINKAAQNLFISQPTLSIALKELEEEIGITIFERSRRGISITSDGIEFLRLSETMLEQLDYMKERYSLKNASTVARFQVSSQHYAATVDAFIKYMEEFEGTRFLFSIKETKTMATIEDVFQRKSIFGVIFLNSTNEKLIMQVLEKKLITFHELAQVEPHVFLRNTHPLAGSVFVMPEQLAAYPMIVYEQGGAEHLAEEIPFIKNAERVIYSQDRGTTNNIIANTNAYNIGTGYLIPNIIPREITSVPLHGVGDMMRIGWIRLTSREPTAEVLRFLELLRDSLYYNYPGEGFVPTKD